MPPALPSQSFWSGKRVLVTGHTGFKGAWLSLWLQMLGSEVTGLALPPGGRSLWRDLGSPGGDRFTDIRDAEAVAAAVRNASPDVVLHLAARALVRESFHSPLATLATNVMGTAHVLEAARAAPSVRAVVNVTSDKAYENTAPGRGYVETDPMGGSDPYSASKGCAELVTSAWRKSFMAGGPQLASARAGNVIGGGDWGADRLVPDAVRAFSDGRPLRIRNPDAVRPWQHVLEPLSGYLVLAERLWEGPGVAEAWNFGPEPQDQWAVRQVADALAGLWGGGAAWERDGEAHPPETHVLTVDASKAKARLDWAPRLDMQQTLAWTVEAYRAGDPLAVTRAQIERYGTL